MNTNLNLKDRNKKIIDAIKKHGLKREGVKYNGTMQASLTYKGFSIATFSGKELYVDKFGRVQYRNSDYRTYTDKKFNDIIESIPGNIQFLKDTNFLDNISIFSKE